MCNKHVNIELKGPFQLAAAEAVAGNSTAKDNISAAEVAPTRFASFKIPLLK